MLLLLIGELNSGIQVAAGTEVIINDSVDNVDQKRIPIFTAVTWTETKDYFAYNVPKWNEFINMRSETFSHLTRRLELLFHIKTLMTNKALRIILLWNRFEPEDFLRIHVK